MEKAEWEDPEDDSKDTELHQKLQFGLVSKERMSLWDIKDKLLTISDSIQEWIMKQRWLHLSPHFLWMAFNQK